MVLAGLSSRTFSCRDFRALSFLSLPSALLLLNPTRSVSSIGTSSSLPSLSLRVLLFLRARFGDWVGTLRCRLEARAVKRERLGLGLERRGNEEGKRRRRFVTCGIVLQFIAVFVFLARVLEFRRERFFGKRQKASSWGIKEGSFLSEG